MAWPNPFRRRDANTRTAYGYTFQLTEDHLTPEQMEPMKHSYDLLGEQAWERLNIISPPPNSALPRNSPSRHSSTNGEKTANTSGKSPEPRRDLYQLLRDNTDKDEVLGKFWAEVNTVPAWIDWEQIARGQDVFYRYGGPNLTGLAFQSLLGGMGAARVVETLSRTGGFSTKVARHRLFETTQHILQCTLSLPSIQPGGAGFASSIRVRLLHAAVRHRIMKLASQHPEYFDVQTLGIPINDLDTIATIGTFSATIIHLSLPRQGIFLTTQEIADYTALWRYIAYLTGTPTDYFETSEKAKKTMEVLVLYEIKPTKTSKVLANNIIKSLAGQPPGFASEEFLCMNARWLNGGQLCDELGLMRPRWRYWGLAIGQCIFFMGICYFYRSIPYLDRRKIAALRSLFWKVIVEDSNGLGEETSFDFKYIPDLSRRTTLREDAVGAVGVDGEGGKELGEERGKAVEKDEKGKRESGVERRNAQTLGVAGLLFVGVGWGVWRVWWMVWERVG